MKKIITIALSLAMLLSMATVAFAADQGGSHDVTAKYEKTENEEAIYNVDIAWGELTFTYSEHTEKTWKPETHSYETDTQGAWDRTTAQITVTNHSNVAVKVAMNVIPVEGTGVEVRLSGGSGTLAAGTEGDVDGAASVTGTLTVSGTPSDAVTEEGIKVAQVSVTIE